MFKGDGSFARKQLEKHGWREGAGLGLREHGIAEAIKVKMKHDTRGVGHDAGKEFTHHWWDHAFNKAANSITVEEGEDGVVVTRKQNSRKERTADAKRSLYSNFIKGSLLSNGTEEVLQKEGVDDGGSSDEDVEQKTHTLMLPEEELFHKCGGRTAHKGARHGLTANGKLSRVEQQERQLLEKYQQARASNPAPSQPYSNPVSVIGETRSSPHHPDKQPEHTADDSIMSKSKKKKNKKRKRDEEEENKADRGGRTNSNVEADGGGRMNSIVKNHSCVAAGEKRTEDGGPCREGHEPRSKKKKTLRKEKSEVYRNKTQGNECITDEGGSTCDGENHKSSVKKKKKKSRTEQSEMIGEYDEEKGGENLNVTNQDMVVENVPGSRSSCGDDQSNLKKKKKKSQKEKVKEIKRDDVTEVGDDNDSGLDESINCDENSEFRLKKKKKRKEKRRV